MIIFPQKKNVRLNRVRLGRFLSRNFWRNILACNWCRESYMLQAKKKVLYFLDLDSSKHSHIHQVHVYASKDAGSSGAHERPCLIQDLSCLLGGQGT